MNYIKRIIESTIKDYSKMFSVVALTGPRQTGKSTTLKKIFTKKYSYVSLDDMEIRSYAIKTPKNFIENLDNYCIIDEAQYSPDIFPYIKIKVDSDPTIKGRFILSGSQQFIFMKNIAESLAGRVGIINMLPLSSEEMKKYKTGINEEIFFYISCIRGTYPEPFINNKIKTEHWYASYVKTYLQRDIRMLYNIGKLNEFETFIRILTTYAGQIMNLNNISKEIGVAVNTIKNWISILQASGIIFILHPYYANISKKLIKSPKIYFVDTGMLCNLLEINTKEKLKNSPMFGSIFENYCVMETIKYFSNRGINKNIYFLKEQDRYEIDILIESGRKFIPVEIKASELHIKEAKDNIEKFILGYKNLPVEAGYVLTPSGAFRQIGNFTYATGLRHYFDVLEKLSKQ